jgi:putative oxidoreductase
MTLKVWREFVLKLLIGFPMAQWAPIPLRLIVGYGFMQHGFAKLSRGPGAFVAILQAMGVPDPHAMAWLTILTELLGGLAVLLGAFVTIVSVPMMAVLVVAMFKVHLPYGFSSIKLLAVTATGAKFGPVGYEVILLYFACLATLAIGGSGPFAIDGLIGKRLDARQRRSGVRRLLHGTGVVAKRSSLRTDI